MRLAPCRHDVQLLRVVAGLPGGFGQLRVRRGSLDPYHLRGDVHLDARRLVQGGTVLAMALAQRPQVMSLARNVPMAFSFLSGHGNSLNLPTVQGQVPNWCIVHSPGGPRWLASAGSPRAGLDHVAAQRDELRVLQACFAAHEDRARMVRDHGINELLVVHQCLRARREEGGDEQDRERGMEHQAPGACCQYIEPIGANMIIPIGASIVRAMYSMFTLLRKSARLSIMVNIARYIGTRLSARFRASSA